MADINDGDVVRPVAFLHTVDLSVNNNVFQMEIGATGGASLDTILDRILTTLELVYSIVRLFQTARTKYDHVTFYNITQDIPLPQKDWPTIIAGALGDDDLAHMTAAMLSFGVGLPRVFGRKFFGGVGESALDQDGLWGTTQITKLTDISVEMLADHVISGTSMKFGVITGVTPVFKQFTEAIITTIPASQKRRRQGVGI